MRLKNLKHKYPEIPMDISNMIEKEVLLQIESDQIPKVHKIKWKKFLIISVAATMAVGTTVFASSKLHDWNVEKKGKYGLKAEAVDAKNNILPIEDIPNQIPQLCITPGYIPEGMEKSIDGQYFYKDTPWQGGINYYDQILCKENQSAVEKNVVYNKMISVGGKEAVYMELAVDCELGIVNNKVIYVSYPESYQRVIIYIGSDVSREDAIKFAENLKVRAMKVTKSTEDYKMLAKSQSKEGASKIKPLVTTATKEEMKNMHQIGDTLVMNNYIQPEQQTNLTVKLTNVQVADDLSLVDPSTLEYQFDDNILDENGKLVQNTINFIKKGDGFNTIDQVIYSKKENQKLVYATVEYTNTGDTTLNDVLYCGQFEAIVETDDGYKMYNMAEDDGNDETDTIKCSSLGGDKYMQYCDIRNEDYKNHIASIEPGETVTVHVGQIVNESDLDKLYYTANTAGGEGQFCKNGLDLGYYDVRQNVE